MLVKKHAVKLKNASKSDLSQLKSMPDAYIIDKCPINTLK